jgi:hypothetical protein
MQSSVRGSSDEGPPPPPRDRPSRPSTLSSRLLRSKRRQPLFPTRVIPARETPPLPQSATCTSAAGARLRRPRRRRRDDRLRFDTVSSIKPTMTLGRVSTASRCRSRSAMAVDRLLMQSESTNRRARERLSECRGVCRTTRRLSVGDLRGTHAGLTQSVCPEGVNPG